MFRWIPGQTDLPSVRTENDLASAELCHQHQMTVRCQLSRIQKVSAAINIVISCSSLMSLFRNTA